MDSESLDTGDECYRPALIIVLIRSSSFFCHGTGRDPRTRISRSVVVWHRFNPYVSFHLLSRMACDGLHDISLWTRLLAATCKSSVGIIENKYPVSSFDFANVFPCNTGEIPT